MPYPLGHWAADSLHNTVLKTVSKHCTRAKAVAMRQQSAVQSTVQLSLSLVHELHSCCNEQVKSCQRKKDPSLIPMERLLLPVMSNSGTHKRQMYTHKTGLTGTYSDKHKHTQIHTWAEIFSLIGRERPWGCGRGSLGFRSFFWRKTMTKKGLDCKFKKKQHVLIMIIKYITTPWQYNVGSPVEAPDSVYASCFHSQSPASNLHPNLQSIINT